VPTETRLPEAWTPITPWMHRTRRPWLGWVPGRWRYRLCVTHAPAVRCVCGMYRIRWGMFPIAEGDEDGEGEE
jgi:hypothetical protein